MPGGPGSRRSAARPAAPEPLPRPVADAHCHLDLAEGVDPEEHWSVDRALAESSAVGVPRIVHIGCDPEGVRWAVRCAETSEQVVAGIAVHPNEAPRLSSGALAQTLGEIDRLASHPRVRAIGETGMDSYRTGPEGRQVQEESFRAHIEIAKRHGKALVIHDRDAHEDVLRILLDAGPPERIVFHCFSGDAAFAAECVSHGWYLSFAGTVTFKNAESLRGALAGTPLERVLVETDAPYLTPAPFRGRPNASYLIPLTVRAMARVLDVELDDLCTALARNVETVFDPW